MSLPAKTERTKILKLLADLAPTIDDLLLSGLASASESTRKVLGQSFQLASQMRLLRLGSTLRIAAEEVGRYASNDALFSRRRYSFFVNRAWMLSRGMRHALENEDAEHWNSLTWQAGGVPVDSMQVVAIGVSKRVVPGAFCGFEFRLRQICQDDEQGTRVSNESLVWSTVFPLKKGVDVPPEAYLRLAQKQKFKPSEFLEGCAMQLNNFQLSDDGRVALMEDSTVEQLEKFDDWSRFASWDPHSAAARLQSHEVNPFELDIELQEEVVLDDWTLGEVTKHDREHQFEIELISSDIRFKVFANDDTDGKGFRKRLKSWSKKASPLFGVMHYEQGSLVLQPLSVLDLDGPHSLSLDDKEIDYRSLMKALDF